MSLLEGIEDSASRLAVTAERAFARRLEGSCESPIAGHATIAGESLELRGVVAAADGSELLADAVTGPAATASELGESLAEMLLARGAGPLLASGADS